MKWLVRAFFGVAAIAAVGALVGLALPSRVHVERAIEIDRPPATMYALLSNLGAFAEWSSLSRRDPSVRFVARGADRGPGQTLVWRGDTVGSGEMTIADVDPEARVDISVVFGGRGRARTGFDIAPREGGSTVAWRYDVDLGLNIAGRYAALGYGRSVGAELEAGLANLRELAESLPGADFAGAGAQIVEVAPVPVVYVNGRVRGDSAEHQEAFDAAIDQVRGYMRANRISASGPVISITTAWEPPLWGFRAAIPYDGPERDGADGPVVFGRTHGGRAVRAVHRGAPASIAPVYARLDAFMAAHRLSQAGGPWEVFVTDREETPAGEQVTEIYFPVE